MKQSPAHPFLPRKKQTSGVLLAASLAFASSLCGQSTTLLDDSFGDDDRTLQSLPASAAIYNSQATTTAVESGGNLELLAGPTDNRFLTLYFTDSGTTELAVGESIRATWEFSLNGSREKINGLRFGLFNSGAVRAASEPTGGAAAIFAGYRGYQTAITPISAGDPHVRFFEREFDNNNLLILVAEGTSAYSPLPTAGGAGNLASDTNYVATLTLTRTEADQMAMEMKVTGGDLGDAYTHIVADSEAIQNGFDTLSFGSNNGVETSIVYQRIAVEKFDTALVSAPVGDPDFRAGWRSSPTTFGTLWNEADSGWSYSIGWSEWIHRESYPWIYVYGPADDWIYLSFTAAPGEFFFYKTGEGWFWSNAEIYPNAWSYETGAFRL